MRAGPRRGWVREGCEPPGPTRGGEERRAGAGARASRRDTSPPCGAVPGTTCPRQIRDKE